LVFPSFAQLQSATRPHTTDLRWYHRWLDQKLKNVPPAFAQSLRSFPEIFLEIAEAAKTGCSIKAIAAKLTRLELIEAGDDNDGQVTRLIVFAVLGWQTMLYEAAFGTCPPQQLALTDVLDGYSGQAFMSLKQDQSRLNYRLWDFLLGFGIMLPKGNICISEDSEDCHAFENVAIVNPGEFNAALLHSLARVNIKWIDVMAPHMEFDKGTNTLFLFRYPSFCLANIPSQETTNGVLHG
jgi:hypothetical protein